MTAMNDNFKELIGREPTESEQLTIHKLMQLMDMKHDDPMFWMITLVFGTKEQQDTARTDIQKALERLTEATNAVKGDMDNGLSELISGLEKLTDEKVKDKIDRAAYKSFEHISTHVIEKVEDECSFKLEDMVRKAYKAGKENSNQSDGKWAMAFGIMYSTVFTALGTTAVFLFKPEFIDFMRDYLEIL